VIIVELGLLCERWIMAAEKDTSKKTESEKVLAAGKAPAEEWIENGTKHIKTKK